MQALVISLLGIQGVVQLIKQFTGCGLISQANTMFIIKQCQYVYVLISPKGRLIGCKKTSV